MGFRTRVMALSGPLPDSIGARHADDLWRDGMIPPHVERRFHCFWIDFFEEVRTLYDWKERWNARSKTHSPLVFVALHDCGGVTRVVVTPEAVSYWEAVDWVIRTGPDHSQADDYPCGLDSQLR